MRRAILVSALLSSSFAVSAASGARAAEPEATSPESGDSEGDAEAEDEDERRAAELVEELMTGNGDEADLAWLYSNADEYAPSDLTGKPIPAPGLPRRGEGSPRVWDPRWPKAGPANYVLIAAGFATAAGSFLIPSRSPWRARNDLDEWGRRTLAAPSFEAGNWARDVSDTFVSVNISYPLLVDSLIIAYWYRRSPELAEQMAWISLEAAAVAMALQGTTAALAARERPFGRDCGRGLPDTLSDCESRDRYRSFFSGHTTFSFTGAAVTCSHHTRHDLFGDETVDGLACATALASATLVGTMRIVGHKHYLTDVMTGAVVGTLSGFGVPWLLHYGPLARRDASGTAFRFALVPLPGGIAAGGSF